MQCGVMVPSITCQVSRGCHLNHVFIGRGTGLEKSRFRKYIPVPGFPKDYSDVTWSTGSKEYNAKNAKRREEKYKEKIVE